MVTVVYLLRVPSFVTRPMLCPSILPRLYYHVNHWNFFRKAAALRVIFIILNNDSQQFYQYMARLHRLMTFQRSLLDN